MSERTTAPGRTGGVPALMTALAFSAVLFPTAAAAQTWREVTASRQLGSAEPVRVQISYGAGSFGLRAADDAMLYRMSLRYDEDVFEPVNEFSGDRLRLGVESTGRGFRLPRTRGGGSMELELGRGVPIDLDLNFGAVAADVDLGGLALRRLELSTGASEARIEVSEPNPGRMERGTFEIGAADFTLLGLGNLRAERIDVHAGVGSVTLGLDGRWESGARLSIEMGVGALELRVPEGLGIELRKNSFLTSFDSQELVRRGDAYYSLDWETAQHKVTIDLDAAFGSVKVVWIR